MRMAGGMTESGVVVGNAFDKYQSSNPIVRWIMRGFESALAELVSQVKPASIHEVGCGEGYWVLRWIDQGIDARGSDFSAKVIEIARENAGRRLPGKDIFTVSSIYDLQSKRDSAELIVCCEVLEHLERPHDGLRALQAVVSSHLILSVPREPLWCALNMVRGKYLFSWGNTPGHIQHWSKQGLIDLVNQYFDVIEVRSPIPWTMLLCRRRP